MNTKNLFSNGIIKKSVAVLLLIVVALVSIFIISSRATSPKTYASIIESIDEKKATVAAVTAASATAATALALIPSDATTPIAERILEISEYLFIVVCILVLEKSLLTVMGYISFNILIPAACALLIASLFKSKQKLRLLAAKLTAFALILITVVPVSVKISDMIYDANKTYIEQVTTDVDEQAVEEDKGWFGNLINKIKKGVSEAGEKAKEVLNRFIDAVAIFIIAYCVMPILSVAAILFALKLIFGIKVSVPKLPKPKLPRGEKEEIEESVVKV